MKYLDTYLKTIERRGNKQLADSIRKTVDNIAPKYLEEFSFCDHEVGLLFGNVQSGKTGQMFGVISAAADLGFPVFLILTTDNVILQQQTIERVRDDLKGFCICDEYDSEVFAENCLMEPAIIVLKKNVRTLKQWSNILGSTGFMRGNPLFIIDDEADAASLNTMVNKNSKSSINRLSLIHIWLEMGAEKMLSGILEPLREKYDYILINTCPSLEPLLLIRWRQPMM